VIEDANGHMAWMNPVIGPNDIENIRVTAVRQVLSNGAWRDLRAVLLVDQLSRFSNASYV
jgi:hypothetical protein